MKSIPVALQAAREQPVVYHALGLMVVRTDGQVFRFCTASLDKIVGGHLYKAGLGFDASAVSQSLGMSVDDLQVEGPVAGVISSSEITEDDLHDGLWDLAAFELIAFDHRTPANGVEEIAAGVFGKVSAGQTVYSVELRDLMQYLNAPVGEVSTPNCRVKKLGEPRCGVNLASFTHTAVVSTVSSRKAFTAVALSQVADYFQFGDLLWTSGANAGLRMEVKNSNASAIELQLAMPKNIAVGDAFTIVAGCDRTLAACKNKFSNVLNFQGEPHKPTGDELARGPL